MTIDPEYIDLDVTVARSRAIREAVRKKKTGNTNNSRNSKRLTPDPTDHKADSKDRKKRNVDLEG